MNERHLPDGTTIDYTNIYTPSPNNNALCARVRFQYLVVYSNVILQFCVCNKGYKGSWLSKAICLGVTPENTRAHNRLA